MPKLNRTTNRLVEMAGKRQHHPQRPDWKRLVLKSPAFTAPERYTMVPLNKATERVQSYPDLKHSLLANVLASPPRMVKQTRTVVPRDMLIKIKLFKSESLLEDGVDDKFNYLLVPIPIGDHFVNDGMNAVAYYPLNKRVLKLEAKKNKPAVENSIEPVSQLFIAPQFKDIPHPTKIGWPNKNKHVFETALLKELARGLENLNLKHSAEPENSRVIKVINIDKANPFEVSSSGDLCLNVAKLPLPLQTPLEIPFNDQTKSFLINLFKACIYYH